jgi:hypothetical protein
MLHHSRQQLSKQAIATHCYDAVQLLQLIEAQPTHPLLSMTLLGKTR